MADTQEFLEDGVMSLVLQFTDKLPLKATEIGYEVIAEQQQMLVRAILQHFQQEQEIDENTSDGYHTFKELYDHRIALFIALMRSNPLISWRANNHEDGIGFEGWFIAGMHLPTGDITYHLPDSDWTKLDYSGIATSNKAPKWDGHTASDVVERLNKWFKEPVAKHEKVYSQSEVDRLIRESKDEVLDELIEWYEFMLPTGATFNWYGAVKGLKISKDYRKPFNSLSKQKEGSK